MKHGERGSTKRGKIRSDGLLTWRDSDSARMSLNCFLQRSSTFEAFRHVEIEFTLRLPASRKVAGHRNIAKGRLSLLSCMFQDFQPMSLELPPVVASLSKGIILRFSVRFRVIEQFLSLANSCRMDDLLAETMDNNDGSDTSEQSTLEEKELQNLKHQTFVLENEIDQLHMTANVYRIKNSLEEAQLRRGKIALLQAQQSEQVRLETEISQIQAGLDEVSAMVEQRQLMIDRFQQEEELACHVEELITCVSEEEQKQAQEAALRVHPEPLRRRDTSSLQLFIFIAIVISFALFQ